MKSLDWSIDEEISASLITRPHLVILGSGASAAAFPEGERNGRILPTMKNFTSVLGLDPVLESAGISKPYTDFEAIFSDIAADAAKQSLKRELEKRIYDYFSCLELPDEPTLYDHLILSLRDNDVIATFNWDPFLCQAAARNCAFAKPPKLLFLHGNVAFAYCPNCRVGYPLQRTCHECGKQLVNSPLLYPIKQKDYQVDPAVAAHWKGFEQALKDAWALTVFGYGAPKTDIEAVQIMKRAWGEVEKRSLEETEIIDLQCEESLTRTWKPFIHTHHYKVHKTFYKSMIACFPRRSCEALRAQYLDCKFLAPHTFPKNANFSELYDWLLPRKAAEEASN